MISLQELQKIYGDFSVESIINRWENFPFGESSVNFTSNNFESEKIFADDEPSENEFESEENNLTQNFEITRTSRKIVGSFNQNYSPTAMPKNKFSPVSIATTRDWAELKAEVLDLHELKNFFVGKQDSQSQQFINLIDKYKKDIEKKIVTPQEIDEDSSEKFVGDLIKIIEDRFYTILTSCVRGKNGKGEMPAEYYAEMWERIKKYFERIGLKSENAKRSDDFRDWTEIMKAVEIPTRLEWQDKKIGEVEIQPRYFEYHGDDGEITKLYIDGKCTVYKFQF